jgi:hypothetical protein
MWNWIRSRESPPREEPPADEVVTARHPGTVSRKYLSLYQYLENRYADVTVLTFSQIEDLLGFALPQLARTDHGWWATGPADVSMAPQTAAWILAGRTATPNLLAETVLFERMPIVRARHLP